MAAVLLCGCAPAPIDEAPFLGQWRYPATTETEVSPNCEASNSCRGFVLGLGRDHTYTASVVIKNRMGCVRDSSVIRGRWMATDDFEGRPRIVVVPPAECPPVTRGSCYDGSPASCSFASGTLTLVSGQLVQNWGGSPDTRYSRVQ